MFDPVVALDSTVMIISQCHSSMNLSVVLDRAYRKCDNLRTFVPVQGLVPLLELGSMIARILSSRYSRRRHRYNLWIGHCSIILDRKSMCGWTSTESNDLLVLVRGRCVSCRYDAIQAPTAEHTQETYGRARTTDDRYDSSPRTCSMLFVVPGRLFRR